MRVAILGLGHMGQALASRLLDGEHEVLVWNRSPGKAADLVAGGAVECSELAKAIDGAEIVVSSLSNDDAVREIACSDEGVLANLGGRPYVDASTISPALSAELAEATVCFVAMPIAGSPTAVREGEATYLVGGAESAIEPVRPLVEALSSHSFFYSSAPLASVAKLTGNTLLLAAVVALAESIAVGRAGGLSDDELHGLLANSPILGPGVKNRLDAVMSADGAGWWSMALGAKDASLALAVASASGGTLPMTIAVRERYHAAIDLGLAEDDIAAVAALYR